MEVTRHSIDEITPDEWDEIARYTPKDYNKQYNNVHSPAHYNQGHTECIDAIEAMLSDEEYIGYLRGNSMKYRWRFRYKNVFEDLNKATWYEKRLTKFMEDHNVLGQKD